MKDPPPRIAVVTGASSGIGMETAVAMARRGYSVVLAARRADRLHDVARRCRNEGTRIDARVCVTDVACRDQVQRLIDTAVSEFGRIDVLVNNAGYGSFAPVHEIDEADLRRIFDVNFFGAFFGCQAVAPVMIRQRAGHIFNVSSVIGKRGAPFHGAYCATKFALCGLSDSMRVEMKPHNVRVTTVCPALTRTEFRQQPQRRSGVEVGLKRLRGLMPPEKVARGIVAAIGKNKPELIFGWRGKLLVALSARWPRLADAMMGFYHRAILRGLTPEGPPKRS